MRKFISSNDLLFNKIEYIEKKLLIHDEKFNKLFDAIEDKTLTKAQGVFFNGQIFDAYVFMSSLMKEAKESVVLIDNYVDESTLVHLSSKTAKGVHISILTQKISKALRLDVQKHNEQYTPIELHSLKHAHDRFLLIDEKIYHLGASLKDLGKKWFAFSLIEEDVFALKKRIAEVLDAK